MSRPAKILVVDDGPEAHDMIELLFTVPGEEGPRPVLIHAWNGREGLAAAAVHQDLDVIVLDLRMPEMDGFQVLEQLRSDRRFQSIPVCVFSGNKEEATRALRLGARDFISKPGDYLEIRLRLCNLAESKRRADAAEKMKIDFLSVVSHELRTPMNGVIGMAQALRDEGLTDEQVVYLDHLERSSAKMLSLVNNLIGFLESENPLHGLPRRAFGLRKMVDDAAAVWAAEAARTGVGFSVGVAGDVPENLLGLPDKVATVLGHLLSNAVKFAPGGLVQLAVTRDPGPEPPVSLVFAVTDTGVGFPEEWSGRMFEPFLQAEGGEARRFGGLGIGLSIASRLVQLLGGTLEVERRPGGGSCFRFTLAFAPA